MPSRQAKHKTKSSIDELALLGWVNEKFKAAGKDEIISLDELLKTGEKLAQLIEASGAGKVKGVKPIKEDENANFRVPHIRGNISRCCTHLHAHTDKIVNENPDILKLENGDTRELTNLVAAIERFDRNREQVQHEAEGSDEDPHGATAAGEV